MDIRGQRDQVMSKEIALWRFIFLLTRLPLDTGIKSGTYPASGGCFLPFPSFFS
jgi:hypothetical protein